MLVNVEDQAGRSPSMGGEAHHLESRDLKSLQVFLFNDCRICSADLHTRGRPPQDSSQERVERDAPKQNHVVARGQFSLAPSSPFAAHDWISIAHPNRPSVCMIRECFSASTGPCELESHTRS